MVIALNLIAAAVLVGGLTGVIVHALRFRGAPSAYDVDQIDYLLPIWTALAEKRKNQPLT